MIIFSDVDGVVTDGSYYTDKDGCIIKAFSTRDFHALNNFAKNGFHFVFLTSSDDWCTKNKFHFNNITLLVNCTEKKNAVINFCNNYGYDASSCIFIGDGPQDLEAMKICGYAYCPKDASFAVKESGFVKVLESNGGRGVIDEMLYLHFGNEYKRIMIK